MCTVCEVGVAFCFCGTPRIGISIESNDESHVCWQRFFVEDIEWAIKVAMDYKYDRTENKVGITLRALGKVVRANVEMTVLSKNPKFQNITIKKNDQPFGEHFFEIIDVENFLYDEAYVSKWKYFSVELSINVLDGDNNSDNTNSDSSDPNDSISDLDNSYLDSDYLPSDLSDGP